MGQKCIKVFIKTNAEVELKMEKEKTCQNLGVTTPEARLQYNQS